MFNNSFGIVFKIERRKEHKKNLDTDKDGVNDELDKCPNTPAGEFVNNDGCSDSQLDSDGDGITNNKDKCLLTPKGEKVDANGCSDSQKDSDGDGVNDLKDKCSSTIKGEAVNADGCSESQLDTDSDGIFNHLDRCPTIKGDISNFGCPINPMAKLEKQVTEIANEVNFVTNKADLLVASKSKLNELIVLLLENPDLKIIISGHTDDVGTEEFNFTLSEKRAQSVLDYLAEKGISKLRMTSLAYGEQQLKQVGISEDSRFKNRRVEIKIIN
jgi:outer membrane protein OmpA-like peptidoglycan-associated protein